MDLATVTATPTEPVIWAVGMLRDPAVQYMSQQRSPYWRTAYTSPQDAVGVLRCQCSVRVLLILP